jgi:starvation-inducible DNA-binding protein
VSTHRFPSIKKGAIMQYHYSPAGMTPAQAEKTGTLLQGRLTDLLDLSLTLKHAHWNVVGAEFLPVHRLLDEWVAAVRTMTDDTAERIATLGGIPNGLPGQLAAARPWSDYAIGRGVASAHLGALDLVYDRVVGSHRQTIAELTDTDLVSADMLTQQTTDLEKQQWLIRAQLQDTTGTLPTEGRRDQLDAAVSATITQGAS